MYTKDESKKIIELDFVQVKIINRIISEGDRVEVIPVKDGAKIIRVKRQEVK